MEEPDSPVEKFSFTVEELDLPTNEERYLTVKSLDLLDSPNFIGSTKLLLRLSSVVIIENFPFVKIPVLVTATLKYVAFEHLSENHYLGFIL